MIAKPANIENEYAKDGKLKPEDVEMLQIWMSKQAHLPKISDLQVILFLQSCYYSIEKTKTCIEKYYTIKYHTPELFKNRNLAAVGKVARLGVLAPLSGFDKECVIISKAIATSLQDFDFNVFLKLLDMVNSLTYYQSGTYENHIGVVDVKGLTLSHVLGVNLVLLKKSIIYLQDAVPIRLKKVHIINVTPAFNKLYSLAKPFVKAELLKLFVLHDKIDTLFDYVPQKYLPKEYGGQGPTCKVLQEKMLKDFEVNAKFFEEEELLVSNESKRINKAEYTPDQLFGIDGTFKKLSID